MYTFAWGKSRKRRARCDACRKGSLFEMEEAVEKLLGGAERRAVLLREAVEELKTLAQFAAQRGGVVTDDVEAAASGGAFGPKGADDDVTAGLHGMEQLKDVGGAV